MLSSIQDMFTSVVQRHKVKQAKPTQTEEIQVNGKNWSFEITFEGAKDVPIGDIISSDPFLEAYLGPSDESTLSFITGVHWNTLNPVWKARWDVENVPEGTVLEMHVSDKDKMKEDTPLGKATLILGAKLEGRQEHFVDLVRPDGRIKGKVNVTTFGRRTVGKFARLDKPTTTGPTRYSRHTSYAAGVLTRESKYEFYAYRVRLYHIIDVFGDDTSKYQHWNVNYDAAKRIFADNLEGAQIRSALHSQHSYLYRHGRNTEYGALSTAKELGELLHGARLKKSSGQEVELKTVVFTYSIIPKGLYFSETGAAFFQDFMSKHAMHANRANEVCFSGEFRIFLQDGEWTLLIDNNSGTYSPKKECLYKVKEIFERNFHDLTVIALDHEDSQLKDIRQRTKAMEADIAKQQKQRFSLFSSMSANSEDASLEK
ncbi:hypothetical protein BGZ76_005572 [Entomortierella beljakovae]|nr:hypothetical protein BGZ76_005572 [Entomortierella beljakovae]